MWDLGVVPVIIYHYYAVPVLGLHQLLFYPYVLHNPEMIFF